MGQQDNRKRIVAIILLTLIVCLAACDSRSASVVTPTAAIPTLMVLPSETPLPTITTTPELYLTAAVYMTASQQAVIDSTDTATFSAPTATETPIPSPTPDTVSTELAQIRATNDAAQRTLSALQTQVAVTPESRLPAETPIPANTARPTDTITPTLTVSWTLTPSPTPDPVIPMTATILYTRQPSEIYDCPNRTCNAITQLGVGIPVIADGTIYSETIDAGNALWYRLNYNGVVAYIYSGRVIIQPPTVNALPEVTSQPVPANQAAICPLNPPPRNCTQAREWGLTAEQAAACGLDRDGDGVACYGD